MKKSDGDTAEKKGVAGAVRDAPPTLVSTSNRVIPRPMPGKFAETFQKAIEGVFSEEEIAEAYRGLLWADRVYMDRHGKELRTPDNQIRAAILKDYLDRTIGRPVERQQVMTFQQPATLETLLERIAESPVLRRTLMEMLQQAEVKGEEWNDSSAATGDTGPRLPGQ
jgi:hypothetical protein